MPHDCGHPSIAPLLACSSNLSDSPSQIKDLTLFPSSLPRTCELLADRLTEVLEQFWTERPHAEVQFKLEAERFSRYILQHGIPGIKDDEHLFYVLREELEGLDDLFGLDNHP